MKPSKADIGKQVRYWDNGWHFAKLIELGRRWALVLHPVHGRISPKTKERLPYRVPVGTVESLGV
jgi:hypothetical protein